MKTILLASFAALALSAAALTPAEAQGGCGPYAHRGFDGFCHPNGWARPYGYGAYGGWRRGPGWGGPGWGYGHGWGYHRHFW